MHPLQFTLHDRSVRQKWTPDAVYYDRATPEMAA